MDGFLSSPLANLWPRINRLDKLNKKKQNSWRFYAFVCFDKVQFTQRVIWYCNHIRYTDNFINTCSTRTFRVDVDVAHGYTTDSLCSRLVESEFYSTGLTFFMARVDFAFFIPFTTKQQTCLLCTSFDAKHKHF